MPPPPAFRAPAFLQLAVQPDNNLAWPTATAHEATSLAFAMCIAVVFLSRNLGRGQETVLGPLLLTMVAGGL